ncbi:hypothetical protein [Chondromyces apiculatus]|uniref:Uncharacterized protein n=1 Tax=Chondromyces apiculatus DSM 436 TaxID=1192034 RepID=A0A017T6I1_9BACT|nr:hypothetical protein [Chondromyces apiculatus]EYF04839.1 Hypothetical protein CAP_3865 [Chondromyces apiculatus DSM 436]
MARNRNALLSEVYDREFPDVKGLDALAQAVQRRAIKQRERSPEGVLRSLAHLARYEDDTFDDLVIDPGLVDALAEGKGARDQKIIAQVSGELRQWLDGRDGGKRQRAVYALVRFSGAASEFVARGLAGPPEDQVAVLHALANPLHEDVATAKRAVRFTAMPAEILPLLRPLLSSKALKRLADRDTADWRDGVRILRLLLQIEPGAATDEVHAVLLDALEVDELRPLFHRKYLQAEFSGVRMPASPAVRSRFERGAAILDKARTSGLPSRVELAVLGALAMLVRSDAALACRTASLFELLGSTMSPETLVPFVELLTASADLLGPEEILKLAGFMTQDPEERLPAAAAAWVRLDPAKAKDLARRFHEGDRARVERRWFAAAGAHMAFQDRKPEIAALIPETALAAAMDGAPSEIARPILESLVRKARNPAELMFAVSIASARRERAVLRPVLAKLQDTPFRIDAKLEALLVPLMGPENEDHVQNEIDGENPFRDRREALARALAAALARRPD